MRRVERAFIHTAIWGIVGGIIGLYLNCGTGLGVIISIAVMGSHIIASIEENTKSRSE